MTQPSLFEDVPPAPFEWQEKRHRGLLSHWELYRDGEDTGLWIRLDDSAAWRPYVGATLSNRRFRTLAEAKKVLERSAP